MTSPGTTCSRLVVALALLTVSTAGCRMFTRPNPQLPPELRPGDGPTASALTAKERPSPPARDTTPEPVATTLPAGVLSTLPSPQPAAVSLPDAPRPSEGKSGRLLIESMPVAPRARELTPLPDNPEFRKALRTWDQGPIRYIILKEEEDLFHGLKTDEDRLIFIQGFWARRDRSPETIDNEYRQEFWRRVSQAERRFIDAPMPGWKTDRGRIWIIMGPPDERDDFRVRAKGPGVLRWIYRNRPNYYLEPNFMVAFRRTTSGIWELSNHPKDFDPVFRDLRSSVRSVPSSIGIQDAIAPNLGDYIEVPSTTLLSLYMDLGQAIAPPELYRVRSGVSSVETTEIFGTMDLRTSFEFLGPTFTGKVRTGIVLGILKGSLVAETDTEEADSDLSIDMSIYRGTEEDPGEVIPVPGSFGPSRENYVARLNDRLLFRTELELEPGSYLAVYRVLDRTSGQSAQARETFTIPSRFEEGLQLSTIVLARHLARINLDTERPDAFTLGRFRVVPELDATYHNGETFAFYYQVHGAGYDPRDGKHRLDVEYSFAVKQDSGWLELSETLIYRNLTNPQAWSVPLQAWPPANYRLRVQITDQVTGERTSNDAYFRVIPGH
ncbi:MAG: GWxTD domain-containing protein [Acidobacteria bacterium]|nr:MAG: GWxTD domain-containing protein [Acidobacteriota bacterium]